MDLMNNDDGFEDLDLDEVCSVAFVRLHALARRGYKPEIPYHDVHDAIWLKHPGKTKYHELILYPDGKVVAFDPHVHLRILRGDTATFRQLLYGTPRPTAWERTADARNLAIAWGEFYVPLAIFALIFSFIIDLI